MVDWTCWIIKHISMKITIGFHLNSEQRINFKKLVDWTCWNRTHFHENHNLILSKVNDEQTNDFSLQVNDEQMNKQQSATLWGKTEYYTVFLVEIVDSQRIEILVLTKRYCEENEYQN